MNSKNSYLIIYFHISKFHCDLLHINEKME